MVAFTSIPVTSTAEELANDLIDEATKETLLKLTSIERLQAMLASLPVIDPHATGAFWLDSGVLKVSSGEPEQ